MYLRRLQEDGQVVFVNRETQDHIDMFSKDQNYLDKLRFEQAALADIEEAEKEDKRIV